MTFGIDVDDRIENYLIILMPAPIYFATAYLLFGLSKKNSDLIITSKKKRRIFLASVNFILGLPLLPSLLYMFYGFDLLIFICFMLMIVFFANSLFLVGFNQSH